MFIIMHCGGIPFNGATIKEKSLGGSESAAYYLAKALAARGHHLLIFTHHPEPGEWDGVTYQNAGEVTQQYPLGFMFHQFAEKTPHDVMLMQRHPAAFTFKFASKVRLLWLHDIAVIRNRVVIQQSVQAIDYILTVSEYHKKQICDTWLLDPDHVVSIHNAVDHDLYTELQHVKYETPDLYTKDDFNMLYQSRPERGLDHLVKPGGIMEQLLEKRPDAKLWVCGYKHDVPTMQLFYDGLFARIEELSNCQFIGHMPKRELAQLQMNLMDILVYPTEFEEVSCITAIEAMAAGLPMVCTKWAALPETCEDSGTKLIPFKDGKVDEGAFVNYLTGVAKDSLRKLGVGQMYAADKFTWDRTADEVEEIIDKSFKAAQANTDAVARHLMNTSDIIALKKYLGPHIGRTSVIARLMQELKLYDFADDKDTYHLHYEGFLEKLYEDEDKWHERMEGHLRFETVWSFVKDAPDGSTFLDYGCGHGHITIALAKRLPNCEFVGIDISKAAIGVAQRWAAKEKVTNIKYYVGDTDTFRDNTGLGSFVNGVHFEFDYILAAELLEHVPDPQSFVKDLRQFGTLGTMYLFTTPYGPWEEMSYTKEHPYRFHLHHYERADLVDLFGKCGKFEIACVPHMANNYSEHCGWYVTKFTDINEGMGTIGEIDYRRKFDMIYPRQLISFCAIVKDGEKSLRRTLDSIRDVCTEVRISVDQTTTDRTEQVIKDFAQDNPIWPIVSWDRIPSAIEIGFDEARNLSKQDATGDWILWVDSDEEMLYQHNLVKLLRPNGWSGYAIAQNHLSLDPIGIITVDLPVRLFRNDPDVKFLGVVHEHPENKNSVNEGVRFAKLVADVHITHYGYQTEAVRRRRFDRNLSLVERDRKQNPDRLLGKFLWMREISHMCKFEAERTRALSPLMVERAKLGVQIWEELIALDNHTVNRMIKDGMEVYSTFARILNEGFEFKFRMGTSKSNGGIDLSGAPEWAGNFLNKDHMLKFLTMIVSDQVDDYGNKYF